MAELSIVAGENDEQQDVYIQENSDGTLTYRFGVVLTPSTSIKVGESGNVGSKETKFRSSWNAKEANGGSSPDADYLYELGRSDLNLNIDTAQNSQNLDSLFTGKVSNETLGKEKNNISIICC